MNNERKVLNIVPKCGCDAVLPFALVYIFYIILHGHLSPGGGFQGGVLMVGVVVLIYLAYGYKDTTKALSFGFMHKTEGFASIMYIFIAMIGVAYGANFCGNVIYNLGVFGGDIGKTFSTGTIFLMNLAVGVKVLTGVGVLALSMVGILAGLNGEKE